MRSTTKYWVRTSEVSAVKHHILQHLPVFQYNSEGVPPSTTHFRVTVRLGLWDWGGLLLLAADPALCEPPDVLYSRLLLLREDGAREIWEAECVIESGVEC